jgi:uncharacterized membrane protein YphA (DoxX/SURF4 family)
MDFTSLNLWLWVAQVLLALLFGWAGYMKTFRPIASLAPMMGWAPEMPRLTRVIGVLEILGAIGIILPVLTGILPWLTPLAALGFAIIQVLAIGLHARRGETGKTLPLNIVLLALAVFVVWGRWSLFGF